MTDVEVELRRENAALREQLADAHHALQAMARGEVDAVAAPEAGTPVLLEAAQEELRSSRTLLRAVFDGSLDALLLADDRGVYVDANTAACELFGLPRDQLLGRTIGDFSTHEYETGARFESFLAKGRMRGQFPLRRPDGTIRVLDFSAVANVSPGLHLSALRDVTDRVAAEDALRRSEVRFRAMIEKGQDGISLLSADVRTIYQSPAVERVLGYRPDEAEQMSWQDFVDEEERPKLASALAKLMEGPGATAALEFRIRKRDGSRCWLEVIATNWLDDADIGAIVSNFRDITERKSLEEQREGFFQLSIDLLCIAGTDGQFRTLNPAWEKTLGWSVEELCARPWLDFVHPDDYDATVREGAKLAEGRVVVRFENRYRCRDGGYRRLDWACIPTSNGLIYACAHDVTAERAAAERDRLLFAASPLPMWFVDARTLRLLDANDAAVAAYGYTRDELLALTLNDIVVEEQRQNLRSTVAELAGTSTVVVQHRTKSGERRRVQVNSHQLNVDGRDALLTVIVDVTEARRMEEERAGHIERLRLLEMSVSRLNDIVVITKSAPLSGPGPEIVYVNEAFERITGYSPGDAIGKTPRMLQGPDTDPAALARLRAALERAESVREEVINYTKAGHPYWVELDVAPVRNDTGELTHFVAIERDTTERHRVSEELRRAEETRAHLAAIVESSEDAIIGVSLDGRITSWNAGAEKLHQYSWKEVEGEPLALLVPERFLDQEKHVLERVAAGGAASTYETGRRRKDGSVVEVAVTISPVRDGDGSVIGISKIARDLTAKRKTEAAHRQVEEQLRQAQKMEAVGRLAGGVAHDFNNLLTVILSYADLALGVLLGGDPMREDMEQIQTAGRRATELTGQLLAFSRQQVLQPRVIDLNEVVQGMQRMLGRLLGEDIDLNLRIAKNLGRVVADPSQIEQVVMNLAVNARDAMPDGGQLTIETAAVELDAAYASAHHGIVPGEYVMIAVSDTGKGMDSGTRARIFEPFFTTKEKGKGTGLGLATVFGIVHQSGGHVGVYSEPGRGSVFKVYLPRTDRTVEAPRFSIVPRSLRGSETILIVEDEEQVRAVASTILRRNGYNVLETANGGEAFLTAKDFPSRIDLLFTDVVMPRMNGRKLADELASLRPEMKVLFASGYTDDAIVRHGVLETGVEFIQKPFTGDALLRRIRAVLDEPHTRGGSV